MNHRYFDLFVADEFLDCSDVLASFQKVRCERMLADACPFAMIKHQVLLTTLAMTLPSCWWTSSSARGPLRPS